MTTPSSSTATSSNPSPAPAVPLQPLLIAMMLVVLLGALEQSITAVALPVIASELNGFTLMAWVVSAYLVASTVVTPIYGKLSDVYGRRTMLTISVTIFIVASAGCAMAQSMPQLVLMRVLQGIGGGGLLSVAQAAVSDVIAPRERGRIQGYFSSVWVAASMGGPIIGGYLTHYLSWHWIFWINLPVGAIALYMVRRTLRLLPRPPANVKRQIDYIGALLLATGLTGILMAITRVGQGVPVGESLNLLLLASGLAIMAGFLWHEGRTPAPIIPLTMLRIPTVAICCTVLFMSFFVLISISVLLPLRLQMAGVSPELSALRLLPLTLTTPIGAYFAGKRMGRDGHYKMMMLGGSVVASLAGFSLALISPQHDVLMAIFMGVLGLGIGTQFPTGLVATQNAVPRTQVGIATALVSFSRLLGGAVGVAVLTAVAIALLRNALGDFQVGNAQDGGDAMMLIFRTVVAASGDANGQALRLAADSAFRQVTIMSACVSLISPLLLLCIRELNLRDTSEPIALAD
jgi:EmrB/QacA subfamily drug resistance transporter